MPRCDMELCPMWDGHTCPCDTFGLDRDDLPTSGTFTVETPNGLPTICECGAPIDCGHCGDCDDCTHDHPEESTS